MLSLLRKLIPNDFPLRVWYLKMWTLIGAITYGFPAQGMPIVGITGTDGKTTTVFFTMQLLRSLGKKVGMASTVGFQIGEEYRRNSTHKTSMGRFGLMKLFREFKRSDVDIAIVEVSSHGLVQGRLDHVAFSTAVITNLSREHLDYHKTMKAYQHAKGILFTKVSQYKGRQSYVVYKDFDESEYYQEKGKGGCVLTYGKDKHATLSLGQIDHHEKGMKVAFVYQEKEYQVDLPAFGECNALNMLAAIEVCMAEGFMLDDITAHIGELKGPPGRMERLETPNGVVVYIDYAVTPKALTELYTTLKTSQQGRVIAVLGACGDRDQGKRPLMGELATRLCDHVIFTNEEPYTEDPRTIIGMLVVGAKQEHRTNFDIVEDRGVAIERALKIADKGDVIVVTGMGDQDSMVVGDEMIPWNDRQAVESRM